ncbi:MAG: dihydropteroate synthase [Rhizobiaceae bacterium]|nr:dihydropteroate synthase [Rhizobiaceae bacterium]
MTSLSHCFAPRDWQLAHGRSLELGPKAVLMGVLNVTPDSFSDGGVHFDPSVALKRARQMIERGAAIIDVGGESTKPNAEPVNAATEQDRVLPIVEALAKSKDTIISIDTYRADTARLAVKAGAHIVNDVWGCQREPDIARVAADTGAGLVIMNTRRDREVLSDLLEDAAQFLRKSLEIAKAAAVRPEQILLDPGFGFAPSIDHDIPILRELERLHELGFPLLVGTSRKRFLGAITGREADQRGAATAATSVVARQKGAAIFRVHDIEVNKDALAVADAVIDPENAP